jgi:predicted dienelactone hydrolase
MNVAIKITAILGVLMTGLAYTNCASPIAPTTAPESNATCAETSAVGFAKVTLPNGLPISIWYPSSSPEVNYQYLSGGISGRVALDGTVANCAQTPLIVFSHGLNGCSLQSLAVTEELARRGYVVAAPDHYDSNCVTRTPPGPLVTALFSEPQNWSELTYKDRYQDIQDVLSYVSIQNPDLKTIVDMTRVGIVGHSLGGYTAVGLAGGWSTWKDSRIKAVLGLSPYVEAFLYHSTIAQVNIPVMYQGGTLDAGITPSLTRTDGAYALSNPSKYMIVLKRAGHFEWTNASCSSYSFISSCLATEENVRFINNYGFAFLDKYVKGSGDQPLLRTPNSSLSDLKYQE